MFNYSLAKGVLARAQTSLMYSMCPPTTGTGGINYMLLYCTFFCETLYTFSMYTISKSILPPIEKKWTCGSATTTRIFFIRDDCFFPVLVISYFCRFFQYSCLLCVSYFFRAANVTRFGVITSTRFFYSRRSGCLGHLLRKKNSVLSISYFCQNFQYSTFCLL